MDDIKERIREISANLMLCKTAIAHTEEIVDPDMVDKALFSIIKDLDNLADSIDK